MQYTRKLNLVAWALALALAPAGFALADQAAPLSKEAFKAEKARIGQLAKAERKACGPLKGHAQDLCEAEAQAREDIALAQLGAELEPGPDADKKAKLAKADAEYDVARLRCEPLAKPAREQCVKQAKGAREAAIRLAKVEKVEELNEIRRAQAAEKREAARNQPPKS